MTPPRSNSDHTAVLIYGGTAPGIVAAVRAAREGLDVTLVTPSDDLGGALPSLGAVETHYRGVRAPLLQEFTDHIVRHYRERYGAESPQYRACVGGKMITFEPHVAETILRAWIGAEPRIRWLPGCVPASFERNGRRLRAAIVRAVGGTELRRIEADAFVEAGDEGDLMACAGAPFRVGREARAEFGEPRAGRVFTRWCNGTHPRDAVHGRLNLVTANATTSDPLPGSTGEGDDNIQSYSYRLCLTDDPVSRRLPASPPPGYDRVRYAPILLPPAGKERLALPFHHRFLTQSLHEMAAGDHLFHGHALPNRKRSWNATNFTGASKRYPLASATERREIERRHREHALGLLWFLQNDPAMPADLRATAREWGLATDEFAVTGNFPPQLYVREARRLAGRATFTEHDALRAPGSSRAPVQADAIAITEFSLDSLACTTERLRGTGGLCDGQLFQMEVSRPGQVPFGALLPPDLDNLLVVTTLSATHVGWGTVRQTPTLMHIAEAAGWAIVLAARDRVLPAEISVERLQRLLVTHGCMLSFFNDCDMSSTAPWLPGVQFAGTRGFFRNYDARAEQPPDSSTANAWRKLGMAEEHVREPDGTFVARGEACRRWFAAQTEPHAAAAARIAAAR
jgi:hypothetical protein